MLKFTHLSISPESTGPNSIYILLHLAQRALRPWPKYCPSSTFFSIFNSIYRRTNTKATVPWGAGYSSDRRSKTSTMDVINAPLQLDGLPDWLLGSHYFSEMFTSLATVPRAMPLSPRLQGGLWLGALGQDPAHGDRGGCAHGCAQPQSLKFHIRTKKLSEKMWLNSSLK